MASINTNTMMSDGGGGGYTSNNQANLDYYMSQGLRSYIKSEVAKTPYLEEWNVLDTIPDFTDLTTAYNSLNEAKESLGKADGFIPLGVNGDSNGLNSRVKSIKARVGIVLKNIDTLRSKSEESILNMQTEDNKRLEKISAAKDGLRSEIERIKEGPVKEDMNKRILSVLADRSSSLSRVIPEEKTKSEYDLFWDKYGGYGKGGFNKARIELKNLGVGYTDFDPPTVKMILEQFPYYDIWKKDSGELTYAIEYGEYNNITLPRKGAANIPSGYAFFDGLVEYSDEFTSNNGDLGYYYDGGQIVYGPTENK